MRFEDTNAVEQPAAGLALDADHGVTVAEQPAGGRGARLELGAVVQGQLARRAHRVERVPERGVDRLAFGWALHVLRGVVLGLRILIPTEARMRHALSSNRARVLGCISDHSVVGIA